MLFPSRTIVPTAEIQCSDFCLVGIEFKSINCRFISPRVGFEIGGT
jgi:hypothetical protein